MAVQLSGCSLWSRGPKAEESSDVTVLLPPDPPAAASLGESALSSQALTEYDEVEWARWPAISASGQRDDAIWISHPKLPLPAYVEVTRIDTGRTIIARVAQRPSLGEYVDLSPSAADQLGLQGVGEGVLRIRRINPPMAEQHALKLGQPGAPRLDTPESLLVILRRKAGLLPRPTIDLIHPQKSERSAPPKGAAEPIMIAPPKPGSQRPMTPAAKPPSGGWFVQIAALSSAARAQELARETASNVSSFGGIYRVRKGPYPTLEAARAALGPLQSKGYPDARLTR